MFRRPLKASARVLAEMGELVEFIRDQYRHCKTILALGEADELLTQAGIAPDCHSTARTP